MDQRQETVVLETDRYRVRGTITLPADGLGSRLSDHINRHDIHFFTIQDAALTPHDDGEPWTAPVLLVSAAHVRLIVPEPPEPPPPRA